MTKASFFKMPFEAKLLLVVCLALFLFGCGSGETSDQTSSATLTLDEAQLAEYPIVYIRRSNDVVLANIVDLDAFNPGANLYVRAAASSSAAEVSITDQLFGADALYDVRDINISYDGTLMVFAARGPYDDSLEENEEQPSVWNLYEYNFVTGEVYSIMNNADAALGHDITPQYLADGRIIFSSSRQQRTSSMLLDEGKPQYVYHTEVNEDDPRYGPSFAIHKAEFDANRNLLFIEQTTFNLSHDFDPVLLDNGKIVFSRWDASGEKDKVSFYQMNPDGSNVEILFGYRSQDAVIDGYELQFTNAQVSANSGEILALLRPFDQEIPVSALLTIDITNFVDVDVPINDISGNGLSEVVPFDISNIPGEISPGGIFSAVVPLFDGTNRAIVSWSFCRLLDDDGSVRSCSGVDLTAEGIEAAPPSFGLWLFDYDESTQTPLILNQAQGESYVEMAIAQPREIPVSIVDTVPRVEDPMDTTCDPGYFKEEDGFGMVHIRSVYDMDGSFYEDWAPDGVTSISQLADPVAVAADERAARFVRFEKPVYMPNSDLKDVGNNTSRFGPAMREILGYAPIQPDGSVKVKIPADVPFMLTIVDQYGRRISGSNDHISWMQVRPGEVMECKGCHQPDNEYPHGRRDAQSDSLNAGALSMTMFPNTNPLAYEVDISESGDGSALETCLPFEGDTMAEVFVRNDTARANISADMVFDDIWTDPIQRTPDESFAYRYSQIRTVYEAGEDNGDAEIGVVPFNRGECIDDWNAFCRGVINYDDHIQPLWEVTRTITTEDGPTNYKCIDCHHDGSAEAPAGQLSLVRGDQNRAISYTDLQNNAIAVSVTGQELNGVTARDLDNNVIVELEKQLDGRYCYRWPDGRLINAAIVNETEEVDIVIDEETTITEIREVLDDDGDPIPLTFTIRESNLGLNTRISRAGARNSNRFRTLFEPDFSYSYFDCGTQSNVAIGEIEFDHSAPGLFSGAELKLLWEWLDIGSAYYNNPFDVPD